MARAVAALVAALMVVLGCSASVKAQEDTAYMVLNIKQALDAMSGYELPSGTVKDREALLALKAAIAKPTTGMTKTWVDGTNPCLPKWEHVQCESGRVSTIQLANLGLQISQLPDELAAMNGLVSLNFEGNAVQGMLPPAWGTTASFQSLRYLNLADNRIESELPASWGARGVFPSLTLLNLAQNNLYGEVPESWAKRRSFASLITLDLHGNNLGSKTANGPSDLTLPAGDEWTSPGAFPTLVKLDLSGNAFGGELPEGWAATGLLSNLRILNLADNYLKGVLPAAWGSAGAFHSLERLLLQNNYLEEDAKQPVLQGSWFGLTAFPNLKSLVIFPGNTGVCYNGGVLAPTADSHYDLIDSYFSRFNGVKVKCDGTAREPAK